MKNLNLTKEDVENQVKKVSHFGVAMSGYKADWIDPVLVFQDWLTLYDLVGKYQQMSIEHGKEMFSISSKLVSANAELEHRDRALKEAVRLIKSEGWTYKDKEINYPIIYLTVVMDILISKFPELKEAVKDATK